MAHKRTNQTKVTLVILLPKTTLLHCNYLLFSVFSDGEDGNGSKLEKLANLFTSSNAVSQKLPKMYCGLLSLINFI